MATYVHDNEKADDSPEYLDQVGRGSSDVEEENEYQQTGHGALKLDPAGLPLIPQPTDSTSDPLNWPRKWKIFIAIQVSILAFFGSFSLATSNPAFAQIATVFKVPIASGSYIGTSGIATAGAGALLWAPLSNRYGRRPIILCAQLIAVAAGFGSCVAPTFNLIIVGRSFVGLGVAAGNVVSVMVIADLFCLHERGLWVGVATVALINGPHVASLPGGYLAQYVGWRWTLWLPSITAACVLVMLFFCLPETLFVRETREGYPDVPNPIMNRMKPWGIHHPDRHLRPIDFARPVQMLYYFPVVFVGMYAAVAFTLGSVAPAQTVSALFKTYYGWASARTGLTLSLSTTIGGVLGEFVAGPVTDILVRRGRKRTGKLHHEERLKAMIPGVILLPIGLLIFGFCIKNYTAESSYVGAAVALALTCFAVQVIISPALAYCIDCYKPQAGEVVLLLNVARQLIAFTVGFWSLAFGEDKQNSSVGFHLSGLTYALVTLGFFVPVALLIKFGEGWRKRLGQPNFNKGI